MKRFLECTLAAGWLLVSAGAPAAGSDTVYQRMQSNGSLELTNVPDDSSYQMLVTGGKAAPSYGGSDSPGTQAEGPVRRAPDVPPSIEARSGKLLRPEEASLAAAEMARQAQDQINAAGGTRERLLDLYQASAAAFRGK